jgi:hypothetical protein
MNTKAHKCFKEKKARDEERKRKRKQETSEDYF